MLTMLIDRVGSALRRALPPACLLCGEAAGDSGLCAGCEADMPWLPAERCPICAVPMPASQLCGRCLQKPPRFDRICVPLAYDYPVDRLIQDLKYNGSLAAARPLAWALARALDAEPYPDLVLPMPISPARLAERGFNQASEIARRTVAEFGLRAASLPVQRRDGAPQAALPWKQRNRNVRGAFTCDADLTARSVAIVDDVLTSGATLDALAVELKRAGAREVFGWIVARTPLRQQPQRN